MAYMAVLNQDEKSNRYIIVEQGTYPISKRTPPNLSDNEKKMLWLQAEKCPLKTVCITTDSGSSSICEHLKSYPIYSAEAVFLNRVLCGHGNQNNFFDVQTVTAENCQAGNKNCIGCEDLKDATLRPDPNKSHCHVVCNH